ncbi:MAG: hypothetical protein GXY32_03405 [Ruminococcaceae bacterium]|nr:hypothetical protein [Oscillospiraceae bacterium]
MKKVLLVLFTIIAAAALALWVTIKLLQQFSVNVIAPIPPAQAGTVRIACIGDSNTYGMMLWHRAANCYPAQLQKMLGDAYSARNYGANSTTVLSTGDHPYVDHKVFALSTDFAADTALIMLGSNDAKPEIWTSAEAFRADYRALLQHYTATVPTVIVVTPPSVIARDGKVSYDIDMEVLAEIAQIERELAAEMGLPVLDIHALTSGQDAYFSSIDGVHMNQEGTDFLARQVYEALNIAKST